MSTHGPCPPNGFVELDLVIRSYEDLDYKGFPFNDYVKKDKIVLYKNNL